MKAEFLSKGREYGGISVYGINVLNRFKNRNYYLFPQCKELLYRGDILVRTDSGSEKPVH